MPSRMWLESGSCGHRALEGVVSGGELNGLSDRLRDERLPAIDLAHADLTGGEQRPERSGASDRRLRADWHGRCAHRGPRGQTHDHGPSRSTRIGPQQCERPGAGDQRRACAHQLRSEVAKELREVQAKTAEQEERKIAAEDRFKRIDIRAPQDGTVHQLAVHTVGGVVNAGEPLMLIVPEQDNLMVEAKVPRRISTSLLSGDGPCSVSPLSINGPRQRSMGCSRGSGRI